MTQHNFTPNLGLLLTTQKAIDVGYMLIATEDIPMSKFITYARKIPTSPIEYVTTYNHTIVNISSLKFAVSYIALKGKRK